MSEQNKTIEEIIKDYANTYCNGDTEKAKEHAIVKEIIKIKEQK